MKRTQRLPLIALLTALSATTICEAQSTNIACALNLNTATAQQLEALPQIGESRATAIIALRTRRKQFREPSEIMKVRGIGRATFRRLSPWLKVSGETEMGQCPF